MTKINISADSQVILLVCSNLAIPKGMESEYKPLTLTEWNSLARKIADSSLKRPEAFFQVDNSEWQRELDLDKSQVERLDKLLTRRGSLAIELKRLEDMGIWALTRSEPLYPERLKKLLIDKAPVIIYGAGDIRLFDYQAVGIVGSREVDEAGIIYTEKLARACVRDGLGVISGGARGVDSIAQKAAIEAGGRVISILSNGLTAAVRKKANRDAVLNHQLLLVSPYHPDARFSTGAAMGRNKYIYALSRFAVVVSATEGKGGTWTGAVENMKNSWVPLFVRDSEDAPHGNHALINKGAYGLPPGSFNEEHSLIKIFNDRVREIKRSTVSNNESFNNGNKMQNMHEAAATDKANELSEVHDLFEIVWPYIQRAFEANNERESHTLAEQFNVKDIQMEAWLQHAVDIGRLEKHSQPKRYLLNIDNEAKGNKDDRQGSLFPELDEK